MSLATFMAEPKPCLDPRPCQCHGTEQGSAHPHHQLHQPALDWLKLSGLCFRGEAWRRLQQTGAFTFPSLLPGRVFPPHPPLGVSLQLGQDCLCSDRRDLRLLQKLLLAASRLVGAAVQPRRRALSCRVHPF